MGHFDSRPSYDEFLQVFKEAVDSAVTDAVLPPAAALFDVPLTMALLDITHAVREKRPTEALVSRACAAFAAYAASEESGRVWDDAAPALRPAVT